MAAIEIRQVRSPNGASPRQRDTLRSLGLGRIGRQASHDDSPQLRGMLRVVRHLVEVEGMRGGSEGASRE
ncbi:MAG: 50S ribosomal protein L30 [Solirubrobacterales bacterium]